ncbi:GNAT family N-acetyltransferase [Bacillus alkalicellulosilyticus]|uniref:GNAT family N-acetyltransferase n=1 Tax=Alkalihalobacterium alkalicellulosilyticum TaxID=1912214 RepID=UPI0009980D3C|nr:GNAT family N-acetyltransferase [Bacillus alkalicellulosilyticus]
MKVSANDIVISKEKSLLQLDVVYGFLKRSYWANEREQETINKSLEHSICYGVYHKDNQIGFARVITDGATMYWLCDVFIDETYRGNGIGKHLINTIINSPELKMLKGFLGTNDAQGLYEPFGFRTDSERLMKRIP